MKAKLLLIVCSFFIGLQCVAQADESTNCWDTSDSTTNEHFFRILFSASTYNSPELAFIKLDFEDEDYYLITSYQVVRGYFHKKFYNESDTISFLDLQKLTREYIRSALKIPFSDTMIIGTKYFYHNSTLDKYRNMGLKEFILTYCEGDKIFDIADIYQVAYLYDQRVPVLRWNNYIDRTVLRLIEESCNIFWDDDKRKWVCNYKRVR